MTTMTKSSTLEAVHEHRCSLAIIPAGPRMTGSSATVKDGSGLPQAFRSGSHDLAEARSASN